MISVACCVIERYKRNLIHLERTREKQMMNLQSGTPFETVTLTTIGRERKLFFDIIEEGMNLMMTLISLVYTLHVSLP